MELHTIIQQIKAISAELGNRSLNPLEKELVQKHLLLCYENLTSIESTQLQKTNELTAPIEVEPENEKTLSHEEINPFISYVDEEEKPINHNTLLTPENTLLNKDQQTQWIHAAEKDENLNEHFENEGSSLNDKFQNVVNKGLNEKSVKGDLKKLIDFNRQFVFIQELFNNDASAYVKAIEQINQSHSLESAFEYLNKEIIHRYKWKPEQQSVKLFEKLVRQKFGV